MLYYLTIGTALLRCDHRLTRLSDSALREGFRWASAQPWTDEAARDLLCRARGLHRSGRASGGARSGTLTEIRSGPRPDLFMVRTADRVYLGHRCPGRSPEVGVCITR